MAWPPKDATIGKLVMSLGMAMVILPEPITTAMGIVLLCLACLMCGRQGIDIKISRPGKEVVRWSGLSVDPSAPISNASKSKMWDGVGDVACDSKV
ncbi:MAG: hypothetical protein DRI39_04775 [Chloroflexi bacterium]|nr:MAG: hypothetical protein DRI39_04775 [Chloroflexota bacterium]